MSSQPSLFNADKAAEMRAYNASLTPAGQKQRGGRGGFSSNYNSGRGQPASSHANAYTLGSHSSATSGIAGSKLIPPSSAAYYGGGASSRSVRPAPTGNPWADKQLASTLPPMAGDTVAAPAKNSVAYPANVDVKARTTANAAFTGAFGSASKVEVDMSSPPTHWRGRPLARAPLSDVIPAGGPGAPSFFNNASLSLAIASELAEHNKSSSAHVGASDHSRVDGNGTSDVTPGPAFASSTTANRPPFSFATTPAQASVPIIKSDLKVSSQVVDSYGKSSIGPVTGSVTANATLSPPVSRPQLAKSIWATDGPISESGKAFAASTTNYSRQNPSPAAIIPLHGTGEPIVTSADWDDKRGPYIASHLQQYSASEAIRDIAKCCGYTYDELTSDGVTLGNGTLSQQKKLRSAQVASSDPTVAMEDIKMTDMGAPKFEAGSEMDIDRPPAQGSMKDSRWGGQQRNNTATARRVPVNVLSAPDARSIAPAGLENIPPLKATPSEDVGSAARSFGGFINQMKAGPHNKASPNQFAPLTTTAKVTPLDAERYAALVETWKHFNFDPSTLPMMPEFDQAVSSPAHPLAAANRSSNIATNVKSVRKPETPKQTLKDSRWA